MVILFLVITDLPNIVSLSGAIGQCGAICMPPLMHLQLMRAHKITYKIMFYIMDIIVLTVNIIAMVGGSICAVKSIIAS